MKRGNDKQQAGFLLIAAVMLIVIIAFFAAAIVFMFSGRATAGAKNTASKKALYIAESGLEYGAHQIATQTTSCSDINMTFPDPITFADGEFKIRATSYTPTSTTLSSSITDTDTSISVASATDFAAQGRIIIDNEAIYYTGNSGNSLTGVLRGQEHTIATPHSSGASVKQQQCTLEAQGAVPNFSITNAEHSLKESLFSSSNQAWSVGTGGSIMYFDGSNWLSSSSSSLTSNQLNAISMTSNGDFGFAVGSAGTILQYNGAWSLSNSGTSENLNSVFTVSQNNAWAVGNTRTILHWNGINWSPIDTSLFPNMNLNSISMTATGSFGFIVGDGGTILEYSAGAWTDVSSGSANNKNLNAVVVVSPSEAWAVGVHEGGQPPIIKWNGISWNLAFDDNETYAGIDMIDTTNNGYANFGLAVGSAGHYAEYNGTSWSSGHTAGGDMHDIIIFDVNDAWAVGKAVNELEHWHGSGWEGAAAPLELFGACKMNNNLMATKYMWAQQYN